MRAATAILVLLALLPVAAAAQEGPEDAYAKYHKAAVLGNLEEAAKFAVEARRKEMTGLAGELREAAVKMANSDMPRAFLITSKLLNPNGRSAQLMASGQSASYRVRGAKPLYGVILMTVEDGGWKVEEARWSPEKPPGFDDGKPKPVQAKPPAPERETFSTSGPTFKLGREKEPCVFKPVMTAEDLERCR